MLIVVTDSSRQLRFQEAKLLARIRYSTYSVTHRQNDQTPNQVRLFLQPYCHPSTVLLRRKIRSAGRSRGLTHDRKWPPVVMGNEVPSGLINKPQCPSLDNMK